MASLSEMISDLSEERLTIGIRKDQTDSMGYRGNQFLHIGKITCRSDRRARKIAYVKSSEKFLIEFQARIDKDVICTQQSLIGSNGERKRIMRPDSDKTKSRPSRTTDL